MNRHALWQDEYWLLLMQLYLKKPEGVKPLYSKDEYAVFTYDIRPTVDFILELMSYTEGLEVLEPIELRNKIRETLKASLKRYE